MPHARPDKRKNAPKRPALGIATLFSRKIVGWATGPTIHREFVLDALLMAVRRRRPRGTLIHSDQGT
jgi:putative transposase